MGVPQGITVRCPVLRGVVTIGLDHAHILALHALADVRSNQAQEHRRALLVGCRTAAYSGVVRIVRVKLFIGGLSHPRTAALTLKWSPPTSGLTLKSSLFNSSEYCRAYSSHLPSLLLSLGDTFIDRGARQPSITRRRRSRPCFASYGISLREAFPPHEQIETLEAERVQLLPAIKPL